MTMNPEVKKEWVDALRSGNYSQTTGTLRDSSGYCCLGVLTQLYAEKFPEKLVVKTGEYSFEYITVNEDGTRSDPETSVLPHVVVEWAGLANNNPDLEGDIFLTDDELDDLDGEETATYTMPASEWNDDHDAGFDRLAMFIENQL